MPFADLILDGQHHWGKERDAACWRHDTSPDGLPHAQKELSFTTATGSVTLGETSCSTSQRTLEEVSPIASPFVSRSPPRPTPSEITQQGNLSLRVPTMHRASTLGGTKQTIALDPHLITLERLGPTSLEATGIEIATRPATHFYPMVPAHSDIVAMIPRVIHIRRPLRPILKQTTDSNYKSPTPFKRVRFKFIKHPLSEENCENNDYKRIGLLTEEDIERLWWSKEELKELEIREWFAARNFVRASPRFAEAFERILIECFKSIEKDPKLTKDQLKPDGGLGLTSEEALTMMMCHDFRGLERSMVHWLSVGAAKHYFNIKRNCTVALIKAQSRWRNVDETQLVKQQKIASSIRNYSLFAERLAQLLAQGDAATQKECHVEYTICPIERSEMLRPSTPRGRVVL